MVGSANDGRARLRQATSYDPQLGDVLEPLTAGLRLVLNDDLVGLYLYGSAVSGGYDAGVSDLDLIAVIHSRVVDLDLLALDRVHRAVVARDHAWDDRLEIVYVSETTLAGAPSSTDQLAAISPGEPFHLTGPAADWLQNWYLARGTGINIFGPSSSEVLPALPLASYIAAVGRYLRQLSSRRLDDMTPAALAYSVLSAARAVRTLETTAPCSKEEGASWLAKRMPEWAWLMEAALACRMTRGTVGFDDPHTRGQASRFVRPFGSARLPDGAYDA